MLLLRRPLLPLRRSLSAVLRRRRSVIQLGLAELVQHLLELLVGLVEVVVLGEGELLLSRPEPAGLEPAAGPPSGARGAAPLGVGGGAARCCCATPAGPPVESDGRGVAPAGGLRPATRLTVLSGPSDNNTLN